MMSSLADLPVRVRRALVCVASVASCLAADARSAGAQLPDSAEISARAAKVMAPLATAARTAPGCAVGISRDGRTAYEGAFGLADLEFGIPNTPQTIFESGSVAKQFTAASIVALALDGKLGLDEPVRKYVPELPDYGVPLTIRHLLNHTSGIRDWGSVLELTGFGRGDRVVSQALAMDVVTHQLATDFTPGAEYSYSNSGYTLLSSIVERISHQKLPAFTSQRFFAPLGMIHTSWRDDYQRLVPGRAQAYSPAMGGWHLEMPFMNVYGNGGMLTTVGDWLLWNRMLDARSMGGALVDSLERQGKLNDGRTIAYALGLTVDTYKGKRQVAHSGATAGYNTYLTRFPDLRLSVAVLCNGTTPSPTQVALRLVDEITGPGPTPAAVDTVSSQGADLTPYVGWWREVHTHLPAQTLIENGQFRVVGGAVLRPARDGSFLAALGPVRWRFTKDQGGKVVRATRTAGDGLQEYERETMWQPSAAELKALEGEWRSDEADAAFVLKVDNGKLVATQRPDRRVDLRPLYANHFAPEQGAGVVLWFTKDAKTGTTMHFGAARMRDMHFRRVTAR